MAFVKQSLMPLYRLEIGEAGESCAIYIARRLGFPQNMLRRAYEAAYRTKGISSPSAVYEPLGFDAGSAAETKKTPAAGVRIQKQEKEHAPLKSHSDKFNIGDSVMVYPQKSIGIVFRKADGKGAVGVMIKDSKMLVNHRRLKLHVAAAELYPENYDFSIVFDTVENRKARHTMERKHDPGLIVEMPPEK
jgi:dsDNA-specific endonuclease/ATPase MutS2